MLEAELEGRVLEDVKRRWQVPRKILPKINSSSYQRIEANRVRESVNVVMVVLLQRCISDLLVSPTFLEGNVGNTLDGVCPDSVAETLELSSSLIFSPSRLASLATICLSSETFRALSSTS